MRIAQELRRLSDENVHGRIIWHAERCQEFGERPGASPLVIGEDFDGLGEPRQFFGAGQHRYFDLCSDGLLEVRQIGVVGLQVDRRDSARFRGRQLVESKLDTPRELRTAGDKHLNVLKCL